MRTLHSYRSQSAESPIGVRHSPRARHGSTARLPRGRCREKKSGGPSLLELFDKGFQYFPVGIADQLGSRGHLGLRLQRHLPQIGSDLFVERPVQASVDPCDHRVGPGSRSPPSSSSAFASRSAPSAGKPPIPTRPWNRNADRRRVCSARPLQHPRDVDATESLVADDLGGGVHQRVTHSGIGVQLLASPPDNAFHHAVAS